jgi:hypothetical protein
MMYCRSIFYEHTLVRAITIVYSQEMRSVLADGEMTVMEVADKGRAKGSRLLNGADAIPTPLSFLSSAGNFVCTVH